MVPKDGGGDQGERQGGGSRQRPPKGKRRVKKGRKAKLAEHPTLADPELAVMIRNPVRTSIIALGHQHLISPVEIAEDFDMPLQYIADQVKALHKAGLLELVDTVKVRGVLQHMYRSTKRAFVTNPDWSRFGKSLKQGMSGALIQDVNGQVARAMEAGTLDSRDDDCLFWECMAADEISWANSAKIIDLAIKALREQSAEAVNRRANGKSKECFPATFVLMAFESPTEAALKKKRAEAKRKPAKRKPAKGKAAKRKRGQGR